MTLQTKILQAPEEIEAPQYFCNIRFNHRLVISDGEASIFSLLPAECDAIDGTITLTQATLTTRNTDYLIMLPELFRAGAFSDINRIFAMIAENEVQS